MNVADWFFVHGVQLFHKVRFINGYLSSDFWGITLNSCEVRILSVLKSNPRGLGVRELKRKTSEKCVRLRLPKLRDAGYVEFKNPNAKRGERKIVLITEKGKHHLRIVREIEKIENEFMKKYGVSTEEIDILTFEKKLDIYEKVLVDIFDACLKADSRSAVRFLKITLFVVRKVLDKKLYDLETHKFILETIQKTLLTPKG